MKVLFLAQYGPLAASSRTRVFAYLPLLRKNGVVCDVRIVAPDWLVRLNTGGIFRRIVYYALSWLRTIWMGWFCVYAASRYNAVFIQKVLFSFPVPTMLQKFRHRILFDFDDAIFTLEHPGENWLARLRSKRRGYGLPQMLQAAGHALVENAYTAEYAARFCPQVSRITGPIDTERYAPAPKTARDQIVLGWIGSPTTTQYLNLLRKPLLNLAQTYPEIELCLIGAGPFDIDGLPIVHLDWSLETEVAYLQTFDIGLMPLPNDPFTRGKGGYKLLQYMAMALPVVASPVEINAEIVINGETGFLAETDAEWIDTIGQLIKNRNLRQKMGTAGRARVEALYSLKKSSKKLLHILESVADPKSI